MKVTGLKALCGCCFINFFDVSVEILNVARKPSRGWLDIRVGLPKARVLRLAGGLCGQVEYCLVKVRKRTATILRDCHFGVGVRRRKRKTQGPGGGVEEGRKDANEWVQIIPLQEYGWICIEPDGLAQRSNIEVHDCSKKRA